MLDLTNCRALPDRYPTGIDQEELSLELYAPHVVGDSATASIDLSERGSSELERVICNRRSCRNFNTTAKLSLVELSRICRSGLSIKDHAVPSAGGLYPTRLFVLVSSDQDGFGNGYYEYDPDRDKLNLMPIEVDTEQLKYCFNSESLPFGSSVQLIIASDVRCICRKYGNRGYRFALMEAGAVAQNISLCCEQIGVGSCELGGILDSAVSLELNLPDGIAPLLGIALGRATDGLFRDEGADLLKLARSVCRDAGVDIESKVAQFAGSSSLRGAVVEYDGGEYAFGTVRSSLMAQAKATVEAYERHRMLQCRDEFNIVNSSGIAAHTSYRMATHKAVMELVERDAIMRNWNSKTPPAVIPRELIPVHERHRIADFEKMGRTAKVLLMISEYAYVVQVVIIGNEYPCFVNGSAASFSFDVALSKAFQEAEYALLTDLSLSVPPNPIDPKDVREPSDHGLLYAYPSYIDQISWLWSGKVTDKLEDMTPMSVEELCCATATDISDLSELDCPIKVVMARSKKLVPIEFGYNGSLPHYFA